MARLPSPRLALDPLADRLTPATVSFHAGVLSVSHPIEVAGATFVTFAQVAANTFQVFDNGASVGPFFHGVTVIQDTGSPAKDTVTLSLGGLAFNGSVAITTGTGNDTVKVSGGAGGINKGLKINTGSGNDTVELNSNSAVGSLFVLGPTRITDPAGVDSILVGNTGAPSSFLGGVTLQGMNTVRVARGQPDVFRNLTATVVGDTTGLDFQTGATSTVATIFGNLRLTGGPGDDMVVDSLLITGNATLNLGLSATTAGNSVTTADSGSTAMRVNGNFTYSGGAGIDKVILTGCRVDGNMNLTLGDGNDLLDLSKSSLALPPPRIGGNLTIRAGNGKVNFNGLANQGVVAEIDGDFTVVVGNGHDVMTLVSAPAGTFRWTSGNGSDTLTLAPFVTGSPWKVNVHFGNKDDTVTLAGFATGQHITGSINFGSQATTDTFTHTANWTLDLGFTLINLP